MQFDDRLATLLAMQPRTDAARAALWSQLIDLLAQGGIADGDVAIESRIVALARSVAADRRLAVARAVGGRSSSAALVRIFGSDSARIASPVLLGARLTGAQWRDVIPSLAPHSRMLLRQRRDLPREAHAALRGFGHSDFAISAGTEAAVDTARENTQIRDLMARIADWRERRPVSLSPAPGVEAHEPAFRFEADAAGLITWTDSRDRAALIGLSLGDDRAPRDHGFDAHATGAFLKRTAFRHARLTLPGRRVSAVAGDPVFRADDGRFLGYRCLARPLHDVQADEATAQPPAADAFRQLAHELRTPLNAVHGFAAMIEAQLLGPVGEPYRERAAAIGRDAGRVLAAIDDVEGWSRDQGEPGQTAELEAIISTVSERCAPIEAERDATLRFRVAMNLPRVAVAAVTAKRLVDALARAVLAAAQAGEELTCEVRVNGDTTITFVKPAAMAGLDEASLFSGEPENGDEGEAFLPLGLAFTLRMIQVQVSAAGGRLDVDDRALVLRLPTARDSAMGASESI